MRILIHTKASLYGGGRSGGAESSLKLLAEKLVEKGHSVDYVTRRIGRLPSLKVKQINGVNVYSFSPFSLPSGLSATLGKWREIWVRRQFASLINRVIRNKNTQIVHTFNEFPATYDILRLKKKNPSFKAVLRVAGIFWYTMCKNHPELTQKIEWVFNNTDLLAFISEGMEQLFEEHTKLLGMQIHNPNRKVLEIGADSNLFSRKWKKRRNSKSVLMMVGRMDYPKRQDLIIEALRILNNKKIELHFFGDGPAKSGLAKLSEEYGLKDQVIFHGFVSQDTIAAFLEQADLFCHASEYEGLCKSIVEALSTGTPALVSDVVSINTYITDGVNGYLVKNDSSSWAERIKDILSKDDGLNSISENEICFVKDNYNPDKKIEEYIEAFSALIDRPDIN